MAKIPLPLRDPLGLFVSPELGWEIAAGGARDVFDAARDTVHQIIGITNEGPVSPKDLEKTKETVSNRPDGSMSGFDKPRKKADVYKKQLQTEQEILAVHKANQTEHSLTQKRETIANQLEYSNISFRDTVNEKGEVRTNLKTVLARVNSELTEKQIKEQREVAVAQATGKPGRIVGADMNRNFEDHNMQSPG